MCSPAVQCRRWRVEATYVSIKAKPHQCLPCSLERGSPSGKCQPLDYNFWWNLIRNEQREFQEERVPPPYSDMNVGNTSGKIKLCGTQNPWLFNKFTELINDFMCLLVVWDSWQEGEILLFMKGKRLVFTGLKWKSSHFFSTAWLEVGWAG